MPSTHRLVALAAQTVAASVALACALMLHRNPPVNVFRFESAISFESMMHNESYNAWFCRHLRCTQKTFHKLCSLLRTNVPAKPYKKYSFQRAVACTLFHLGSSGGVRETAQAFGVSKAWSIVYVNAVVRELAAMRVKRIKLPQNIDEWDPIIAGFRRVRRFPFCCGAMDGTLIAINRPRDFEGWYNRKGFPSVNVQAVCDQRKRFISFDIRPGSWSDSKIFQHSTFDRNIDRLLPRGHHVLADSGYGITPEVMTPYSEKDEGGILTSVQAHFNFNLSSTRMAIEGAFGLLKERFRILKKPLEECTLADSVKIIVACLVLHNLLIDLQDNAPIFSASRDSTPEAEGMPLEIPISSTQHKKLRHRLGKQKRR